MLGTSLCLSEFCMNLDSKRFQEWGWQDAASTNDDGVVVKLDQASSQAQLHARWRDPQNFGSQVKVQLSILCRQLDA